MKWSILLKKAVLGFFTGTSASMGAFATAGVAPTQIEPIVQSGIVGLLSALTVGVTNYFKSKDIP